MMLAWLRASLTIDRALRREDRDDAGVGREARLEGEDRLGVLEGRQARLELLVEAHGAGDRAHRPEPAPKRSTASSAAAPQLRMGVEPEVVVRAERDDLAPVDDASALLLALDDPQPPIQALRLQLLDLGVEERERVPRAGCGGGRFGHDAPRAASVDALEPTVPVTSNGPCNA